MWLCALSQVVAVHIVVVKFHHAIRHQRYGIALGEQHQCSKEAVALQVQNDGRRSVGPSECALAASKYRFFIISPVFRKYRLMRAPDTTPRRAHARVC